MEGESLAAVEPEPDAPVLPRQHVALELEGHALGLGDHERLEAVAERATDLGVEVVAGLGGDVLDVRLDDAQHLLVRQVDVRDDAVDGMGPHRVGRVGQLEREHPCRADLALVRVAEGAGRQRDTAELVKVGDAPAAYGVDPAGVRLAQLVDTHEVLVEDRALPGVGLDLARGEHRTCGDVDIDPCRRALGKVQEQPTDLAGDRVARPVRRDHVLARLDQGHVGEAGRLGHHAGRLQSPAERGDVRGAQRVQRVRGDADVGDLDGHDRPSLAAWADTMRAARMPLSIAPSMKPIQPLA